MVSVGTAHASFRVSRVQERRALHTFLAMELILSRIRGGIIWERFRVTTARSPCDSSGGVCPHRLGNSRQVRSYTQAVTRV
jgi:hypothetical protein